MLAESIVDHCVVERVNTRKDVTMIGRIVGAIRLDWRVFRDIAQDKSAMREAAIIVAIVNFLAAIGSAAKAPHFLAGFIGSWISGILVGWILWAIVTDFVGKLLFKGEANIPAMLRVLGYASAPLLLRFFGFLPFGLGWLISAMGWVLALVAGVIAVREASRLSTSNAIVTVFISWLVSMGLQLLIGGIIG
jgi:hypothetical protein